MRFACLTVAFVALLVIAVPGISCPFCNSTGTTLSQDVGSAGMILFGTLKNPRINPNEYSQGQTDLEIELVIKSHDFLAGRKVITLPRYIPTDPKQPGKYLVFCDIFKGKLDPYRGIPFKADSKIATYLKGAIEIRSKDLSTRLNYFFDFLNDDDAHISSDAFMEFGNVDYKDFRPIAEKFPAQTIVKWLNDPKTTPSRFGLYGSMLGHCGKPADAATLTTLIDENAKRTISGLDGLYAGLVMLKPKEGWEKITDALNGPKTDFPVRYEALKTVQFLWEYRTDIVRHDDIANAVALMIEQPAVADLAIEKLRLWKHWKPADKVMALANRPGFDESFIKRALIRYALQCPAQNCAAAAAFVAEQRTKNPEWVKDAESMLSYETAPTTPITPTTPAKAK